MAILKPGQLASGSYTISGSFSGSFQGSGAGLNNIPSSAIVGLSSTQIASGAVTASVSTGTGSFTVTSGSSTFIFISSSGNVGIGTSTPLTGLELNSLRATISIRDTTGTTVPSYFGSYDDFLQMAVNRNPSTGVYNNASKASAQISIEGSASSGKIYFFTTNTNNAIPAEAMRINGTGNVLIGTTTDTGYRLDINGTARVQNDVLLTTGIIATSAGTTRLQSSLNYFSHQRLASSGAFGWDIRNSAGTQIAFWNYDAGSGNVNFGGTVGTPLLLSTNNTTRATITVGGNVLINTTTDTGHKLTVSGSGTSGSLNVDNTLYVSGSRVGVGTGTPTETLDVSGSARVQGNTTISLNQNATTNLAVVNTDTTNASSRARVSVTSGTIIGAISAIIGNDVYMGAESAHNVNFTTAGATKFNINNTSGNVSIGVLASDMGARLGIRGSGNTSATKAFFVQNSSATDLFTIWNDGAIGINTSTNAGYKLDVNGTARLNASSGNDIITDGTNVTINGYAGSSSVIRFQSRNAAASLLYKFIIPNQSDAAGYFTGNVGIGTSTPSAALHISGSSGSALFEIDSPALNNILFVSGSGRVGIGTGTPTETLDVNGTARVQGNATLITANPTMNMQVTNNSQTVALNMNATDGAARGGLSTNINTGEVRLLASFGGYFLTFFSNNSERMRIPTTGNVLIGTTTDAGFRLDVNGTARVQDTLSVNSSVTTNIASSGTGYEGYKIQDGGTARFVAERLVTNFLGIGHNSISGRWDDVILGASQRLYFYTGASERARFAATTGNFIINTTTDTGHKLTVSGSGTSGSLNVDNTLYVSGSRVGIGTSTPLQALSVVQPDAIISTRNTQATAYAGMNMFDDTNTLIGSFAIGGTNASVPALAGNMLIGARTSTGRLLIVGGPSATTLATMFSTGNFAINTTTDAGYKLDVNGTARVSGNLTLTDTSQLTWGNGNFIQATNSIPDIKFYVQSSLILTLGQSTMTFGVAARTRELTASSDATFDFGGQFNRYRHGWLSGQLKVGDATAVNASAKVQIDSTTQGFLPPRMTGAQAEAISSPAEGLMVYATSGSGVTITSKGWWGYDGATWVKLN